METEILCLKDLLGQIDVLKARMIEIADLKGFNHHDTIKISQELDVLLNKYQKMRSK